MSQHRAEQVGSILKRAVQERLLRGLADPRVRGLITITQVKVSSDLKNATVYVSISPESEEKLTMHGLKNASRHIRHQISDRVSLAHTPQLTFKLDHSLKTQSKVLGLISQGVADIERREQRQRGVDPDAGPAPASSPEADAEDRSTLEHEAPAPATDPSRREQGSEKSK